MNIPSPADAFPPRPSFQPGDRSTRLGGEWHLCRVHGGSCEIQSEFGSVLDSVPDDYRDIAEDRFEELWDKATRGQLVRNHPYPDMRKLGTEPQPPPELAEKGVQPPILFEIRVQINASDPDPKNQILLRLYYAEPENFERMLLAIHFARKPGGDDSHGIQQDQIDRAGRRYYNGLQKDYNWGY